MNKQLRCIALCMLCVFAAAQFPLIAEETKDNHSPVPYTKEEFPLWQRELRRFEILSLGALPFVTLFSFWGYDMIRAIQHPKNPGYYPWPFKQADKAIALTEKEQLGVFLTAAGISITIALIDITYRAIKRSVEKKRLERENAFTEDTIQFIPTTLPIDDESKPAESGTDTLLQTAPSTEKDTKTAPLTSVEQIFDVVSVQDGALSKSITPSSIPASISDTPSSPEIAPASNTLTHSDMPRGEREKDLLPAV